MGISACAILCAATISVGQVTTSSTPESYELENNIYGWGMRLDNFGITCDPRSRVEQHFFDFDPGVTISLDAVTNQAYIDGTIRHISSNQLWTISATLSDPLFTSANSASTWHNSNSNALYSHAIADLISNGANEYSPGEGNLKNESYSADRLAFLTGETHLSLQSGQGSAAYVLPGQTDGEITLYDFPQADGMLPFMLAKGHRINATTDQIAGFGWLDARPQDAQHGDDGLVQDYLFRLGDQVPPENNPPTLTFTLDGGNSGATAGDITINEGTSVIYAATGSDGDAGDVLSLTINATGDGSNVAQTTSGVSPLENNLSVFHAQDSNGTGRSATATVTDAAGNEVNITRNVTVLNVAPTILTIGGDASIGVGDISIDEGTTIAQIVRSTDPGADVHSFTIGGVDAGLDNSLAGIRQSNLVTRTFVDDAVVDNTFTATDDEVTTSLAGTLTVNNVVPTLTRAEMASAVRSGGGDSLEISLAATDPGLDTITFHIQQDGAATSSTNSGLIRALAVNPSNTISIEASGQTTPGSTRIATATLDPFVGLNSYAYTVTATDEDQPGVASNSAPLNLEVVGPLTGYTVTDYAADGSLQTRSGLPLDDSINPGGVVDTGETINLGVLSTIVGPRSRTVEFVLSNMTHNDDMGELTALSILDLAIDGTDAHQFSLWETDGVTPFDPSAHEPLSPGESLELLIEFTMDDRVALKDHRTADLTVFTDQGAAFGQDGAAFLFHLSGLQVPEPASIAMWLVLGVAMLWLFRRR